MDTYLRLPGQVRVVLWTAHWASHREGPYLAPQLCLVAWNGETYKYPLKAQLQLTSFLVQAEFEKREPYERCFQDFSTFLYICSIIHFRSTSSVLITLFPRSSIATP